MNEEEARAWLRSEFGALAVQRLERFATLLLAEATRQSLIARSTFDTIWSRHIADCAQLVRLAPVSGLWLDVGSGGGLPGVVVALLRDGAVTMVDPRAKRCEFLRHTCDSLNLMNAHVTQGNVQSIDADADVISARAVSTIENLFGWTNHLVSRETLFLLQRGASVASDLASARKAWQGSFHVEQSLTDPAAGIVVANNVRPR